jgi:N-acetylmuramoyl-L-alanine amidase/type II secretory pathway predicted ATPase ExeA
MFLDFYQLREQPFGVTPDPAYLYPSRTHSEALDALREGIQGGRGFLALIAEPGMGKTTLLYQVLDGLRDTARSVFLFQTQCNSREFFEYLLTELGIDTTGMGLVAMHVKLNEMLFAEMFAGKRFVLIVDEAQNLDDSVLETIRLLSNFETPNTKLLQIVLAGQPQLGEKLGQKQLAQLLQRITVVKYLEALSPEETADYIRHRLKVAGYCGEELFEPDALALIALRSEGVPRNINKICFHALLEAHAEGLFTVSRDIVERADRKLQVFTAGREAPIPAPSPALTSAGPAEPAGVPALTSPALVEPAGVLALTSMGPVGPASAPATPRLTYKPPSEVRLRARGVWAVSLVAILLSAGLALPRNTLSEIMQIVRIQATASVISPLPPSDRGSAFGHAEARFVEFSKSLVRRKVAEGGEQTTGVRESAENVDAAQPTQGERGVPNVTAVQASSAENNARVIVMLGDAVQYESARITSPDRIYFDLYNARLSPSVAEKTIPTADGLLKWVRTAQNRDDVVRLVLDADGAKDYSAQLLSDPYRLVIDVHAQPIAGAKGGSDLDEEIPQTEASRGGQLSLTRELGLKINRIAIDPGHGGYDTGAMGPHGLVEKSLCLDVALRLGQLIEENIPTAEVVYTRKNDRYVSLEERTAIANRANADLFISIHANSSSSREVRGIETYYLSLSASPESMELAARENALAESSLHDLPDLIKKITRNDKIVESRQLAGDIQSALSHRLELVSLRETNRGVKQAPFVVLTGADMPAVLSEISFVSNASDESLLLGSSQRQRVAEGLYHGIAAYLDSLHSLPKGQKLVTENGPSASSVLGTTTAAIFRNPLKLLTGRN